MLTPSQITSNHFRSELNLAIQEAADAFRDTTSLPTTTSSSTSTPQFSTTCYDISANSWPMANSTPVSCGFPVHASLLAKPPSDTTAFFTALLNSAYNNTAPPLPRFDNVETLAGLMIRQSVTECASRIGINSLNIHGSLTITSPDQNTLTVSFNEGIQRSTDKITSVSTPSKRKAYQPIKYFNSCPSPSASSCSPTTNSNNLSGSTSPSTTDSGALDLSRASSFAGSAPITPMKTEPGLFHQSGHFTPFSSLVGPQTNLLEMYQQQFHIFDAAPTMLSPGNSLGANRSGPNQARRHRPTPSMNRRQNAAKRFLCNQCREEFASLHDLEQHTMTIHGNYRCHVCRAPFTQRSNLQRHALKHVGFKPFECKVCKRAYYRKDHLMRHMEMSHPGYSPRDNIIVHLTSSESLEFLTRNSPSEVDQTIENRSEHGGESGGVEPMEITSNELPTFNANMATDSSPLSE